MGPGRAADGAVGFAGEAGAAFQGCQGGSETSGAEVDADVELVLHGLVDELFGAVQELQGFLALALVGLALGHHAEKRGALEVASKSLEVAGQVFRYAITTGRARRDPSRDLRGALQSREVRHYKALKESELPEFLEKLLAITPIVQVVVSQNDVERMVCRQGLKGL